MDGSFESGGSNELPEPQPLSEQDLEILSGNLDGLRVMDEFRNQVKFVNIILNGYYTELDGYPEEEEIEEEED